MRQAIFSKGLRMTGKKGSKNSTHLIKRLSKYIKPYSGRFYESLICMFFYALFNALQMFMFKPACDYIFKDNNADKIPLIVLIIILITLMKGVSEYLQNYLSSFIGQRVVMDIRNEIYTHLQKLSLDYFIKHRTGHVVARITNDVMLLQRAMVIVPQVVVKDGLAGVFLIGLMFYLKWQWALIGLTVIPVMGYALMIFARKLRKLSSETQARIADIYSYLHEKIMGISLIKAFCMEENEIKKFKNENVRLFNVVMKTMRTTSLQSPLMEGIAVVGLTFILAIGGYSVINHKVTPGTFFAFIATISSFYQHLRGFGSVNRESQDALSATERIFYVLDARSFILEAPDAIELGILKNSIVFENISFNYSRKQKILDKINIEVKKGEIVAIVGVSGSGKTTIVNLMARFYDPSEGKVIIDGIDIRKVTLKSLRMQMGMVTQETILFNDSVRNNIAYGVPEAKEEKIIEAAKIAGAHEFIMNLPDKYSTTIGDRGVMLSGGERQRIAIARAMLKEPTILILDEATSSLDSESEYQVQKALDNLMKKHTVFIITHRLSSLQQANKIVVIDKGHIACFGTHSELLKNNEIYKRLYNLQFRE